MDKKPVCAQTFTGGDDPSSEDANKETRLLSLDIKPSSIGDFGFEDANEEIRLFYDSFAERYFKSTISRVLQAEYHLNRNFLFVGYVSLNQFYKFLGIDETPLGDTVGWNSCNGDIYWIDFSHSKAKVDDGLNGEVECYIIDMISPPDETYLDDV